MTNEELFDWCCNQNCKEDFNCDLCMYNKGRADKYQEIVSEYMLLTEKQVAEIRADAIDKFEEKILEMLPNEIDAKVHNGSLCLDICALAIQLKEQNNDSSRID